MLVINDWWQFWSFCLAPTRGWWETPQDKATSLENKVLKYTRNGLEPKNMRSNLPEFRADNRRFGVLLALYTAHIGATIRGIWGTFVHKLHATKVNSTSVTDWTSVQPVCRVGLLVCFHFLFYIALYFNSTWCAIIAPDAFPAVRLHPLSIDYLLRISFGRKERILQWRIELAISTFTAWNTTKR